MSRKPNSICRICGQGCYRRPVELARANDVAYCSKRCYGIACRKEVPCVICGTPMLAGKNAQTCGPKCRALNNTRANRSHSKGRPKKSLDKLSTRSVRARTVESRDACECCGYAKRANLVVHHVIERYQGGTDEPGNLLVLCPNCHGEIHRRVEGDALNLHLSRLETALSRCASSIAAGR